MVPETISESPDASVVYDGDEADPDEKKVATA
jgi:hypothetical protein